MKIARLQGELAENRRASEDYRSKLVADKVQRQLAMKERDEMAEKWREAVGEMECLRKEAVEVQKQLQDLKA